MVFSRDHPPNIEHNTIRNHGLEGNFHMHWDHFGCIPHIREWDYRSGSIITTEPCSPEPWNHSLFSGNHPQMAEDFRSVKYDDLRR